MTYIDIQLCLLAPQGHATYLDESGRRRHRPLGYEPYVMVMLLTLIHEGGFVP